MYPFFTILIFIIHRDKLAWMRAKSGVGIGLEEVVLRPSLKMTDQQLSVTLEFSGGAELLFDKVKKHDVILPGTEWTIQKLIFWVKDNLLKERPELFIQGKSVRPGILVLVNDADWELMGELEYKVSSGDCITFISTLHGG